MNDLYLHGNRTFFKWNKYAELKPYACVQSGWVFLQSQKPFCNDKAAIMGGPDVSNENYKLFSLCAGLKASRRSRPHMISGGGYFNER